MDVDRIKNESILEAMANAIEKSKVIVIAMTEKYQESNACRQGMY